MSGFLFSTAGLRESWRYSSYPDLQPLASQWESNARNRRSTTRPSWVRFPSDLHLTALPELPPPPPSKLRLSGNSSTTRHGDTQRLSHKSSQRSSHKTLRESDVTQNGSHKKKHSVDDFLHPWEKPAVPFNRQYDRPWLKQQPPKPWFSQLVDTVYGNEDAEPEPPPLGEDIQNSYPKGWKWFLLILSGALPYVVVCGGSTFGYW